MGFKLGSTIKNHAISGEIQNKLSFNRASGKEDSIPGTPVIRKSLDKGIMGEANNDGTMFISDKLKPGSEEERHVIMHEMVHMTDMKLGKLAYNDNYIKWNGKTYRRENGMIEYEGQMIPEGDTSFPWEKMPWE